MKKTAQTTYKINELIAERWSPRAFSDDVVTDEEILSLFEAARWAPSSMNEQPWRFIYARKGEEAHNKLVDSLMDGNKPWAKNAPVLIAGIIKKTLTRNGKPNGSARYDLGLAVGNLSIQATDLGLSLHQMGGFSPESIKESFGLTDDYEAVVTIALGHIGDPDSLDDTYAEREKSKRSRKPREEVAFHGKFNV
ncbi:MAG: nitroreductase family protein [Cyclobacteriaceae bacterium]